LIIGSQKELQLHSRYYVKHWWLNKDRIYFTKKDLGL